MSKMTVVFKIYFSDSNIRRFSLDSSVTYDEFIKMLQTDYPQYFNVSHSSLKYVDKDGDKIAISIQMEWEEMMRQPIDDAVKLYVESALPILNPEEEEEAESGKCGGYPWKKRWWRKKHMMSGCPMMNGEGGCPMKQMSGGSGCPMMRFSGCPMMRGGSGCPMMRGGSSCPMMRGGSGCPMMGMHHGEWRRRNKFGHGFGGHHGFGGGHHGWRRGGHGGGWKKHWKRGCHEEKMGECPMKQMSGCPMKQEGSEPQKLTSEGESGSFSNECGKRKGDCKRKKWGDCKRRWRDECGGRRKWWRDEEDGEECNNENNEEEEGGEMKHHGHWRHGRGHGGHGGCGGKQFRDPSRIKEKVLFFLSLNRPRKLYKAKRLLSIVLENYPEHNAETFYYLACVESQLEEKEQALESLSKAIENGFNDVEKLANDPYLANIRETQSFKELVSSLSNKSQTQLPPSTDECCKD